MKEYNELRAQFKKQDKSKVKFKKQNNTKINYKDYLINGNFKIAIWGTGYIGLSTMAFFAKNKVKCVGYDIDKKKVNLINAGNFPIKEIKGWFGFNIKNLVKLNYLKATNDYTTFYDNSFIAHFIAIPTEQDVKPYFKILFKLS